MTVITRIKVGSAERQVDVKAYDVPDLWHHYISLKEGGYLVTADEVLDCWYLCHDLIRHIEAMEGEGERDKDNMTVVVRDRADFDNVHEFDNVYGVDIAHEVDIQSITMYEGKLNIVVVGTKDTEKNWLAQVDTGWLGKPRVWIKST